GRRIVWLATGWHHGACLVVAGASRLTRIGRGNRGPGILCGSYCRLYIRFSRGRHVDGTVCCSWLGWATAGARIFCYAFLHHVYFARWWSVVKRVDWCGKRLAVRRVSVSGRGCGEISFGGCEL